MNTSEYIKERYHQGVRDFRDVSLKDADLRNAKLMEANFEQVDFSNANLCGSDLENCNCNHAIFSSANIGGSNLKRVTAIGADFRAANLGWTCLEGAVLDEAVFSGTSFCNVNLSEASLKNTLHRSQSTIGTDTIQRTLANCPQDNAKQKELVVFLRGCGVEEFILRYFSEKAALPKRPQYYSTFISYSHQDSIFVKKLFDSLQANGIRCWCDTCVKPGDSLQQSIQNALQKHQKLLICCSSSSLNSHWVTTELAWAVSEERIQGNNVIIPIDLDGYLRTWEGALSNKLKDLMSIDFKKWKDEDQFKIKMNLLIDALEKPKKRR